MTLASFLVQAKKATYASKKPDEILLPDKSHTLTFFDEDFEYKDRYFGSNPFSGQEVVWENNKLVWSMNYYGRVLSKRPNPKRVFKFLKTALNRIEVKSPFRGPMNFTKGKWEYICEVNGGLFSFVGKEKIYFKNIPVYALDFHGGKI